MSASQLWSPAPQRPAQNAAKNINSVRANMIPGTWLQLSPTTSPSANGNNFLSLSPVASALPSPALKATEGSQPEELALSGRFLTNHGPSSRTSSFSSIASVGRQIHPSLGQKTNYGLQIERREMAVARAGGIGSAFNNSNH